VTGIPPAPEIKAGTGIRAGTVLPARRTPVTLPTADGLELVGELALPADTDPVATLICLHPLPTQGGMMDSHLLKKAAARLPALAQLAVLRFNTRGTTSAQGTSQGTFGGGEQERHDFAAAVGFAAAAGLPAPSWPCAGAWMPWTVSTAPSSSPHHCAAPPTPTWTAGPRPASRWWPWCRAWMTTCGRTRPVAASPASRRPR
jgi:hypothetical protein